MATAGVSIGVSLAKTALGFIGAIFAKHAAKVKAEASTLNGAVPAWRNLLRETVIAYNSGEIDANQALAYVEQAKSLYYQQVRGIQRGSVPTGGVGIEGYLRDSYGRFAPIDPCNGACYIGYYYVEPEAALVEQAIRAGGTQQVTLSAINIRNGDSVPTEMLTVEAPIVALNSFLPESVVQSLPAPIRKHPLASLLIAVVGLAFIGKAIR